MIEDPWIESASRWFATYAVHSAVLALAGLVLAAACLRPGERRATVLKLALLGGVVSASLPWKAVGPFALMPAPAVAPAQALQAPLLLAEAAALPAVPVRAQPAGLNEPVAAQRLGDAAASRGTVSPLVLAGLALLAGALFALVRTFRSRAAFIRGLDAEPARDALAGELLGRWSQEDGRPAVVLTTSDRLRSPVVVSSSEVCVPRGLWSVLSADDREATLAHEYAHIERRDPLWFMVTAGWSRALFFLPWHGWLRRRWVESAEFACDRRAAERLGSETRVAHCLASVAEWSVQADATTDEVPHSMAAMAAVPSELVQRVKSVLETGPAPASGRFRWVCAAALAAFACGAPGVGPKAEGSIRPSDVEIVVQKDGQALLTRSKLYPELAPLQILLSGREAKAAVSDWLVAAVSEFPWISKGGMPDKYRSGAVTIRADEATPMRHIQHLMALCADVRVQISDVRLELGGEVYLTPISVEWSFETRSDDQPIRGYRADIRIVPPAEDGGPVSYRVALDAASPEGTVVLPEEELESIEEEEPILPVPAPRERVSSEHMQVWIGRREGDQSIRQASIDAPKGVTSEQVRELLDALLAQGVTDVSFKGSFERW